MYVYPKRRTNKISGFSAEVEFLNHQFAEELDFFLPPIFYISKFPKKFQICKNLSKTLQGSNKPGYFYGGFIMFGDTIAFQFLVLKQFSIYCF